MKKVFSICFIFMLSSFVFANFSDYFSAKEKKFTLDPIYDGIIFSGGASLTIGTFIAEKVSDKPVFEEHKLDLSSVNSFDKWAARPYSKNLHLTGTITEVFAMLTPITLVCTNKSEWGVIAVMYAESVLWANGFKELTKNIVHRYRPYMYFENPPIEKIEDGDFCRSFPSGHSTVAFNGAMFTSYVFSKYFPESKWKIPVIVGSFSLATATAIQRVLSGNHFITDVLAGAFIGSVTGFIVPFLHTLPLKNEKFDITISPVGFYGKIKL